MVTTEISAFSFLSIQPHDSIEASGGPTLVTTTMYAFPSLLHSQVSEWTDCLMLSLKTPRAFATGRATKKLTGARSLGIQLIGTHCDVLAYTDICPAFMSHQASGPFLHVFVTHWTLGVHKKAN